MRTGSYAYHVARRDALAFGGELDVSRWDRFSAESEDACELYDALQSYDEHAAREYARVLTRQRIKRRGYDATGRCVRSVAQLQARLISDTVGIICCDGLLTDSPSAVY